MYRPPLPLLLEDISFFPGHSFETPVVVMYSLCLGVKVVGKAERV